MVARKDHEKYAKFFKMLKMKMPLEMVSSPTHSPTHPTHSSSHPTTQPNHLFVSHPFVFSPNLQSTYITTHPPTHLDQTRPSKGQPR